MREMIRASINNQLNFRCDLMDSWFAAKGNNEFIAQKKKHFIAALKDNRLIALSLEDKKKGKFTRVSELALTDKQAVRGLLKGYDQEIQFL